MRLNLTTLLCALLLFSVGCADETPSTAPGTSDSGDVADVSPDTVDEGDADASDAGEHDATGDADGVDLDAQDARDDTADASPDTTLSADDRPAEILFPSDYDASKSYPLVIALHGYGMSGDSLDTYFELSEIRDERQFLLVSPDGLRDSTGQRYWNATEYCCDHYGNEPDDATYLSDLVDEAIQRFAVDPELVYFVGFSNGGFMAHRMACDYPSRVAGIASLSGSSFDDADACGASSGGPKILHVHGTGDTVVGYYGTLSYPGARTVAERWVERNACDADATDAGRSDFDFNVAGDETWRREWEGCQDDTRVALWSLQGGLHMPTLRDNFGPAVLDFLFPGEQL